MNSLVTLDTGVQSKSTEKFGHDASSVNH